MNAHDERVAALQATLKQLPRDVAVTLRHGPTQSNVTRRKEYALQHAPLDMSGMRNVVRIDRERAVAVVEPGVTMEALVAATLPYGLMPNVVPEFRGITVGGAISGVGAESSSHRYGLFSDACSSFRVLLGDGELVRAAPDASSDLYYGVAGAYGSLGVVVEAEVALQPASRSIAVQYHHCSPREVVQRLVQSTALFVDGLILSPEHACVMEGRPSDTPPNAAPRAWFYQHAMRAGEEFWEPADYLFRYDPGAFWMGSYLMKPQICWRFFMEGLLGWRPSYTPFPCSASYTAIGSVPWQQRLCGWMSSQRLYGLLHKAERWVGSKTVIQDFCLPRGSVERFIDAVEELCGIYPLWLCPIKGSGTADALFAPNEADVVNVGVYGVPRRVVSSISALTHALEQEAQRLGGRKILYSHCAYSEEEFWQIYPRARYEALREKYRAVPRWLSIEQKVLT